MSTPYDRNHPGVSGNGASATDVVLFNKTATMPRDLYDRSRRIFKFFYVSGFSAGIWLLLGTLTPTVVLLRVADVFNRTFWMHFKAISFEDCTYKCHMMAYSTSAIACSAIASVVLLVPVSTILTIQSWGAITEAHRRGYAPFGRDEKNAARPIHGPIMLIILGLVGVALFLSILAGVGAVLFELAGSSRNFRNGSESLPWLVSLYTTVILGVAQLSAASSTYCLVHVSLGVTNWIRRLVA